MFGPLVRDVCSNASGALSHAQVRTAGVLALCKLMCVSAEYCEENLQVYACVGVGEGERERVPPGTPNPRQVGFTSIRVQILTHLLVPKYKY